MSKLHYLNQEYKPGAVFDNLSGIEYDMVVGLDIGHGECMAYIYHKNSLGEWVADPLTVTEGGETHIPSYIAYGEDKKPIIGSAAAALSGLQVYFKRDPGWWETLSDDGEHTYGRLMKDFISTLWKTIVRKNDIFEDIEKTRSQDKVLITVGCPASGSWTEQEKMEEYKALVAGATGYNNTAILPESNGAIMAAISAGNFDLSLGVAIYDLGSSTLDFTYILMGKVLITASIPLGGSDIDKAMLRYIAKENDVKLGDMNSRDLAIPHTDMRRDKEHFYNTDRADMIEKTTNVQRVLYNCVDEKVLLAVLGKMGIPRDYTLSLEKQLSGLQENDINKAMLELFLVSHDMQGVNITPKTRKDIYKKLSQARTDFFAQGGSTSVNVTITITQIMLYALDKDMMDEVIWEDKEVAQNKLGAPYTGLSWGGCVEKFFEVTKESIELGGYPCDTVVLTGGTSKVAAVEEIAGKHYPGPCKVIKEPDPSASVAKGLCLAKGYELGAKEQVEKLKNELHNEMEPYFEQLCQDFGKGGLYDLFWDKFFLAAGDINDGLDHQHDEFGNAVQDRIQEDDTFVDRLQNKLNQYIADYIGGEAISNIIADKANTLSQNVFKVGVMTLPKIPANLISSAFLNFDKDTVSMLVDNIWFGIRMQRMAIDHRHSGVLNGLLKIGAFFSDTISASQCRAMVEAMSEPGAKENTLYRDKLGGELGGSLKFSEEFKNAFLKLIDEQFEIAVGIVLFQIFEK